MDAKELINSLTVEQITDLLVNEFGSNEPKIVSKALAYTTICHNTPADSNSYKLYYYDETKSFRCYTQCQESFDVISLTMKVKDMEFSEAMQFLCNRFGFNNLGYRKVVGFHQEFNDNEYLAKYLQKKEIITEELTIYDDKVLNIFHKNLFYQGWIDEGITIDTMIKFGIRYDSILNRVIIPHLNPVGKLIGVKTRFVDNDDIKYLPLFFDGVVYKYQTGFNLYGLYYNYKAIMKNRKVVIFEGEKSVLKACSYYGDNNFCLALCGSNLTQEQVNLLLKLNINEVIIAVDKEYTTPEEALIYAEKIKKVFINKLISFFTVSVIWDTENKLELKDSPIDKGRETFEYLFENRIILKE